MAAFFVGFLLFALGFCFHLVIWRIRRPRATAQALIALMVVTVLGGALCLGILSHMLAPVAALTPNGLGEWSRTIVVALAVAAAYVMTYPGIEVESPTLAMIDVIARNGSRGVTKEELYRQFGDDVVVTPRLEDLLLEGLAHETSGRVALTGKGLRLAQVFGAWRRLLGLGIGG